MVASTNWRKRKGFLGRNDVVKESDALEKMDDLHSEILKLGRRVTRRQAIGTAGKIAVGAAAAAIIAGGGTAAYFATRPAPEASTTTSVSTVTATATTTSTTTATTTSTTTSSAPETGVYTVDYLTIAGDRFETPRRAMVPGFEKENPDTGVVMDGAPILSELFTRAPSELLNKTGIYNVVDVLSEQVGGGTFAAPGSLLPLDDLINDPDIGITNPDDYPPVLWAQHTWGGQTLGKKQPVIDKPHRWSVPIDTNSRFVYYRQDILKNNGYDTPPTNWDDVLTMAKAITKPDQNIYGFAYEGAFGNVAIPTFVWAFGGDVIDLNTMEVTVNNDIGVMAMDFLKELIQYAPPGVVSWTDTDVQTALGITGNVAYAFGAGDPTAVNSKVSKYADQILVDRPPETSKQKRGGHNLTLILGVAPLIPITTKDPRKTFKFIEYLQRPSNMQDYIAATGQPGRLSALKNTSQQVGGGPAKYLPVLGDTLLNDAHPWWPIPEMLTVETILGEETAKGLTGKQTSQQTVGNIETRLTALFKQAGYYG